MSDDRIKSKPTANPHSRVAEPASGPSDAAVSLPAAPRDNGLPADALGPSALVPVGAGEFLQPAALPMAIGLACQWEALAAKPGNVHRLADFADMGLVDFLSSAVVVAGVAQQWLPRWAERVVSLTAGSSATEPAATMFGEFVFDAVRATRQVTATNTNLGICLLLGPLAESFTRLDGTPCGAGGTVSERLVTWSNAAAQLVERASVDQTRWLYRAIALASPGGMGHVDQADVDALSSLGPTDTVAHVMRLAAERDTIAAEYGRGFTLIFNHVVPDLAAFYAAGYGLQWATIATFVRRLARQPDTLIARKVGWAKAGEVATWAQRLADEYFPDQADFSRFEPRQEECEMALGDLDFALRGDGHRLNPGTTADLIAAGLFVAVMAGMLALPARW